MLLIRVVRQLRHHVDIYNTTLHKSRWQGNVYQKKNPQLNLKKYDVNSVVKTEALIKDFWDFFQLF